MIVDLRIDHISSRVDENLPQTFHARMLYIMGLWEEYLKMDVHERARYRGFSFQKHKGWRSGSCTLNVPTSAINAFRNSDFDGISEFRSGLARSGYNDDFAKLVGGNQMDIECWIPLKKVLLGMTSNGPETKLWETGELKDDKERAEMIKSIIEKASQNIYDLQHRRWKLFSANQKYCGFVDLNEGYAIVDSFYNIAAMIVDLRIDHISSRVDENLPQTFHARMLYIMGLWEEYLKMDVHERARYRGFSFQKHKGWRAGSCTLNVPISAINAFRNNDFDVINHFRSGLLRSGHNDDFAKLVGANQMDSESWIPLKKVLLGMTSNGPEVFHQVRPVS